jgi:hypothetical protein
MLIDSFSRWRYAILHRSASCSLEKFNFVLLPPGLREAHSPFDAINYFQQWFAAPERFEMIGHTIMSVADRMHIAYRLHLIEEGAPKVREQRAFMTMEADGIQKFDLVCSGILPRRE